MQQQAGRLGVHGAAVDIEFGRIEMQLVSRRAQRVHLAGHPIDALFWCAGTWGPLYPLAGSHLTHSSMPRNTSLLTTRALAAMHRRGLASTTVTRMGTALMPIMGNTVSRFQGTFLTTSQADGALSLVADARARRAGLQPAAARCTTAPAPARRTSTPKLAARSHARTRSIRCGR